MPDLTLERESGARVAGIDEAGRGPWAGPVAAAAVVLKADLLPDDLTRMIDDSKRLTRKRREAVFERLPAFAEIGVGLASVEEIDRLNILVATHLAMGRAFDQLVPPPSFALVDGNRAPTLCRPARCVVGGDAKSLSIAAASIVAKVMRDRIMAELAASHPGYGWERNAGYGTAEHRKGLDRLGVTIQHRTSFAPIQALIPKT